MWVTQEVPSNLALAAITLAIIPSILIYVVLQRQFISGLAAGATKG